MPNTYSARGTNQPGGAGKIETLQSTLSFDGSDGMGTTDPGPAHLLAGSLAACILKNVERFSHMLPFAYASAAVDVTLKRQDSPPKIVGATYTLTIDTEEREDRAALLHMNILKYGTITNTLAAVADLAGTMRVQRADGSVVEIPPRRSPRE